MSTYKPVEQADHGEQDDDLGSPRFDGPAAKQEIVPETVERRFFKTSNSLHTAISVAAGCVMCLFGYEQGVFGGIIVGEDFLEYFHDPSPGVQGFVVSVYDLGCFGGALLTLAVGEKLGRKRMLIIFTIIVSYRLRLDLGATTRLIS